MAYVNFFAPYQIPTLGVGLIPTTGATVDANGETNFTIGQVFIPGGGSKVLSAAGGGRIYWVTAGGIVFASGSTDLRVGVQDVSAGAPDGTYDVYAGYVGGVDTLTNSSPFRKAMTSGTKTITNGQIVAIGHTMVTRGGVDVVTIDRMLTSAQGEFMYPYGIANGTHGAACAPYLMEFDDGTVGWIHTIPLGYNMAGSTSAFVVNSGTTPDEYCMVVTFDTPKRIVGGAMSISAVGAADAFELIFYSNPLVTPTVIQAITFSGTGDTGQTTGLVACLMTTPYDLAANTTLGVAIRPTSANSLQVDYWDLTSGFDKMKRALAYKTVQMTARTNQTGAFVETQAYHLPYGSIWVGADESGAASASGGSFTFLG